MDVYDVIALDLLLERLRALPEDELRLLVAALAVADKVLVAHALLYVGRIADSVSEAPGG